MAWNKCYLKYPLLHFQVDQQPWNAFIISKSSEDPFAGIVLHFSVSFVLQTAEGKSYCKPIIQVYYIKWTMDFRNNFLPYKYIWI